METNVVYYTVDGEDPTNKTSCETGYPVDTICSDEIIEDCAEHYYENFQFYEYEWPVYIRLYENEGDTKPMAEAEVKIEWNPRFYI